MKKLQTIKVWNETRKELKLLSALRDSSMIQVLDDLVKKALEDETQGSQDTAQSE